MSALNSKKNSFRRVLEPVTQRFVSADYIVSIDSSELENVQKIEFSPPKLGDSTFGRFKLTYKTPHLCEVNR